MNATFWGTRGSLACPGPETMRYGGNTPCVEVCGPEGTRLILDAGSGLRRLGADLKRSVKRVDLLLTHLHLDHIIGLGFFWPLHDPEMEVHFWGPKSETQDLKTRLCCYLSPPLFPVHISDLPCKLTLHELLCDRFEIGEFTITSDLICHPGPTLGYRIETADAALAYLPDHEPALGVPNFPLSGDWTSGYHLAKDVDLLIHDATYSAEEYPSHAGWGHSSMTQAIQFATLAQVRRLALFHHDPSHSDFELDKMRDAALAEFSDEMRVTLAEEGTTCCLTDLQAE